MKKTSIYDIFVIKLKNLILGRTNKIIGKMEDVVARKIIGREESVETKLFNNGRQNFIRLKERFKHNDTTSDQIISDWYDYLILINDVINIRKSLGSNEDNALINEKFIRINEINKRFDELLGNDFIDS